MGRPSKEYQAFTHAVDRLLTVPYAEVKRRVERHREEAAKNPRKRGPKPKVTSLTAVGAIHAPSSFTHGGQWPPTHKELDNHD